MNFHYQYHIEYPESFLIKYRSPASRQSEEAETYLRKKNREIAGVGFSRRSVGLWPVPGKKPQRIELKTVYPGLLIGVGYPHEMGGKGDLSLGISLDYVTGAPYLPGSSVKGILRSAFAHPDVIRAFCKSLASDADVTMLAEQSFGGEKTSKTTDVFLDAVIGPDGGCVLDLDTITPHRQSVMKELGEPNPISFLKVATNVPICFRFLLTDAEVNGVKITAETKCALFRDILLLLGVGAKTNVGYGALTEL